MTFNLDLLSEWKFFMRMHYEQERDVLQERKEAISNYLNLFLSIWFYFYLSESISIYLKLFLSVTIFEHIRLYLFLPYLIIGPNLLIPCYPWLSLTFSCFPQLFLLFSDNFWLFLTLYDNLWIYLTTLEYICSSIAISGHSCPFSYV